MNTEPFWISVILTGNQTAPFVGFFALVVSE